MICIEKYRLFIIIIFVVVSLYVRQYHSYHYHLKTYHYLLKYHTKQQHININNVLCLYATSSNIISPFDSSRTRDDNDEDDDDDDDEDGLLGSQITIEDEEDLPLTRENVELVLDQMRPYLKADGGDVKLSEIDGPIVKLELVGACGTCPSSSMTMKMGLERKLKERIPEIAEVIQSLPNAPTLNTEAVEIVLDGVRPFLAVAGGKISVVSITGVGGLQPVVALKMEGTAAALQSVKIEIMQRVQRHFMLSLRIDWVK